MNPTMRFRVVLLLVVAFCYTQARGQNLSSLRTMLVFGDSTVDPGNNNGMVGASKADFPPYGIDFYDHKATGRFCDGRLATDFISEILGVSKSIPAFLDPHLQPRQLINGVSFASAASGYDLLTSTNADVISFPKQIEYLSHYRIHLQRLVGPAKAQEIIKNAVVVFSCGVNDIVANYYLYPDRPKQYTISQYTDYMSTLMASYIKEIHSTFGVKRFVVVGVPPIGCLPVIKFLANSNSCVTQFSNAATSFNTRVVEQLDALKKTMGLKTSYIDCYGSFVKAMKDPVKYGFGEMSKGCCGSGTTEYGDTCKGQPLCKDLSSYMFFDAVHPTQKMYRLIAEDAMLHAVKDIL